MLENVKFKSSDNSGSILAAYFIGTLGVVAGTLLSAMVFLKNPEVPIAVLAIGGTLALLLLLLRLRPDLPSACLWLFTRGRTRSEPEYVPRIIKSAPTTFGTNRPPTAEELRELKDNPRNWVPSNSRAARLSLRDDRKPRR